MGLYLKAKAIKRKQLSNQDLFQRFISGFTPRPFAQGLQRCAGAQFKSQFRSAPRPAPVYSAGHRTEPTLHPPPLSRFRAVPRHRSAGV